MEFVWWCSLPYYHRACGGEVSFWARTCKVCKHHWPFRVLFDYPLPLDMSPFMVIPKEYVRKKAKYAKWIEANVPGAGGIAAVLPNWPKWARYLATLLFLLAVSGISYLIYWGFNR